MDLPVSQLQRWILSILATGALLALAGRSMAQPPSVDPQQRIARLIEQLGDEDYFAREGAQATLAEMGFEVYDAVKVATTHADLEIAARAKFLLNRMAVHWTDADDPAEVVKLLSDYQQQDMPTKLTRMSSLAALPDRKGHVGLCRLVRFERSAVLSKHAALLLLSDQGPDAESAALLAKHLSGSPRTAARWIAAYARLGKDREAALADFTKLVDAEHELLREEPTQSSRQLVTELIHKEVAWLKAAGENERAIVAMRRLLSIQPPRNVKALVELIDWLIEQEAWPVIEEMPQEFEDEFSLDPKLAYRLAEAYLKHDLPEAADRAAQRAIRHNPGTSPARLSAHFQTAEELRKRGLWSWAEREYLHVIENDPQAEASGSAAMARLLDEYVHRKAWAKVDEMADRFAAQFPDSPILQYTRAQAAVEKGQSEQAEEIAKKALELNAGTNTDQMSEHLSIATMLRQRGLFDWARQEYEHVAKQGKATNSLIVAARYGLSEMLHDQGQDLEAAQVRQKTIEVIEEASGTTDSPTPFTLSSRSRMNYFRACHYRDQGDRAKQREYLDKALDMDPADTDALIACFQLEDQSDEYRAKIRSLVAKAAAVYRRQMAQPTTSSTPYNQFAWLVANTEGDLDEALRCSKKAIELSPDSSGFLDTLAHVYFARTEYEMAYQTQVKAVAMEPKSGLMNRQLEVFRKKWEASKKESEENASE